MDNYFFDFDGTLADSGQTAVLATQAAFRDYDLVVPDENTIAYFMGVPIEVSFKKMAPEVEFTDYEFKELLAIFRSYYKQMENSNLELFPHIKKVLQELNDEGKQLFVVSSKHSAALMRNLEQLEIEHYFKAVLGSDQVKKFKPAPDGLLYLIKKYNLDPSKSVMIGDAIFDLQMGNTAGVATCAVTWGTHKKRELVAENPTFVINKPKQLLKIN
ncbi:HAD family hydrolase [Periweissella fabalis]|uniref:HAD family hydrolase n=1 Tax=Periweissella fabalis TaxID=1070421 RepID=A0A7X6N0S0_9LACO|nr:HAD family hydrolase [Periweissella fabalis]MCM0599404.1 HAD family hydrolase [Periweissella fabalis]NKZ23683.1 HAD family hydrolase [Periweissella fabalis]